MLPGFSGVETATADVWATGLSVDSYPTQLVRDGLDEAGVLRVEQAYRHEDGAASLLRQVPADHCLDPGALGRA